ncbi:MAG: cytochrome d ubiquinol oxidase subunit II [Acidobacteriota bacterium]
MVQVWFSILCVMIILFVVLDGWDFGAGALHFVVGRNQDERRTLIAAIGPLWSWHEVWLVGIGGILFVAFPQVLSVGFPAYYLALFLVLWTLVIRGLSLEFRGHIADDLWRSFWDFALAVSNTVLAVLIGVAAGNILRGIPLGATPAESLPLFTDFGVRGNVGLLDWYVLSIAFFTLVCLCAHGASYLATKTEGPIYARCRTLALRLWITTVSLLPLVSLATFVVRPQLFDNCASRPLAWLCVAGILGAIAAIFHGYSVKADRQMFLGGCLLIAAPDWGGCDMCLSSYAAVDAFAGVFDHSLERIF